MLKEIQQACRLQYFNVSRDLYVQTFSFVPSIDTDQHFMLVLGDVGAEICRRHIQSGVEL